MWLLPKWPIRRGGGPGRRGSNPFLYKRSDLPLVPNHLSGKPIKSLFQGYNFGKKSTTLNIFFPHFLGHHSRKFCAHFLILQLFPLRRNPQRFPSILQKVKSGRRRASKTAAATAAGEALKNPPPPPLISLPPPLPPAAYMLSSPCLQEDYRKRALPERYIMHTSIGKSEKPSFQNLKIESFDNFIGREEPSP